MHSALEIRELVDDILRHMWNDDDLPGISRLAQTCHSLEEPSLDALWCIQESLVPLVRIMSTSILESTHEKLFQADDRTDLLPVEFAQRDDLQDELTLSDAQIGLSITASHLSRLPSFCRAYNNSKTRLSIRDRRLSPFRVKRTQMYANRIRGFRPFRRGVFHSQILDVSALEILFSDERIRFPSLQELCWPLAGITKDTYQWAPYFLSPSLRSFSITHPNGAHVCGIDSGIWSTLGTRCIDLEELDVFQSPSLNPETLGLLHMLTRVRILCPVSMHHFIALASLPNLDHLDISPVACCVLGNLTVSHNHSSFPSLQSLALTCNTADLLWMLDYFRFPAATSFYLSLEDERVPNGPADAASSIFQYIIQSFPSALCCLSIHGYLSTISSTSSADILVPTSKAIKDMFVAFPDMELFALHGEFTFDSQIDDSFLEQMALAWPKLRDVVLDPDGQWSVVTPITLGGVRNFARHLPNLVTLGIRIHADGNNLPENEERSSSLRRLSPGRSFIQEPQKVAAFLSESFPHLDSINIWGPPQDEINGCSIFFSTVLAYPVQGV
ncbi:hypothetical protein ABKN59_011319 [Abortiporus biennis]